MVHSRGDIICLSFMKINNEHVIRSLVASLFRFIDETCISNINETKGYVIN